MRERIIAVRKAFNLKQLQFAQRLGIKQSTLSNIETGQNGVSDANVRLICITFNVNETWLRSGEGPMFSDGAPGSLDEAELLDIFRKLLPPTRNVIMNHVKDLLDAQTVLSSDR
jgi:transcriptional regulator with XRE-family HTH domain